MKPKKRKECEGGAENLLHFFPQLEWQDSEKLVNTAVSSHPSLGQYWRQRIWVIIKVLLRKHSAKNCGFRQSLFLFSSVSKTGSLSVVLDPQENYGACIGSPVTKAPLAAEGVGPAVPRLCPDPRTLIIRLKCIQSSLSNPWPIKRKLLELYGCWMESIILWWVNQLDLFI